MKFKLVVSISTLVLIPERYECVVSRTTEIKYWRFVKFVGEIGHFPTGS